ncbi:MAG TPA: glycoside hydrolase family 97 N-terminal domain-containing protein, partial [Verrucomicrobiae bacterium]
MKKYFSFTGFACLCLVAFTTSLAAAEAVVVASPDGKVKLQLTAEDGVLRYDVAVDGQPVLEPSKLGIVSDGNNLGEGVTLGQIDRRKVNERYRLWGAHAEAVNRANEVTVTATSHGETFAVDIHVANDGAAARLRLAAKANRQIQGDSSAWRLPGNPALWATTLNPCYEDPYFTTTLDHLGTNAYGLPLTAKAGNVYVTLTEALLKDYGDLAVKRSASGDLQGFLFADPRGWTTDAAVVQPWRVTIVARDLTALVNSTLVADLNPPADPALLKASWIKPGRSAWQWMAIGAPHLDDQRQWVDWTKALGFEYYLVDEGWKSWPGNWAALASVCSYAKTNNVKVWLWVHSREVRDATARKAYFRRAVEAGVVGVKIDFPPACNRWWSNWYYDTAADAAACQLMVDFHGAVKPTGLERTWPNVLTREGIRGHEWHMTRYHRLMPAAHDTL